MNKMKRLHILILFAVSAFGQTSTLTPCVTHIPPGRHTDYIWPFSYIPRSWTAHASCKPPKTLIGADHDLDGDDVPDPGHRTLQFSPRWGLMFSFQTKHHLLFRIGTMRYDFSGRYFEVPTLALKRLRK